MNIKFPKDFSSNTELHLSLGRIAIGSIENPIILRYTLAPNGNLTLTGSEGAKEYINFFPAPEGVFGFV